MTYITLGTHPQPFPRLLDLVAPLIEGRAAVVQHGMTPRRDWGSAVEWVPFIPFDEVLTLMQQTTNVVTHAGVGSVMTAIAAGIRPAVVPRLKINNEHVDDHQEQIANRLARDGLVWRCDTTQELAAALGQDNHTQPRALHGELRTVVADDIRAFIS